MTSWFLLSDFECALSNNLNDVVIITRKFAFVNRKFSENFKKRQKIFKIEMQIVKNNKKHLPKVLFD